MPVIVLVLFLLSEFAFGYGITGRIIREEIRTVMDVSGCQFLVRHPADLPVFVFLSKSRNRDLFICM